MRRSARPRTWALLLLLAACRPPSEAPASPPAEAAPPAAASAEPDPWASLPRLARGTFDAHLQFLADDAQEGRPPGTDADRRVQDHVEAAMIEIGLNPAFGEAYRQPLTVTDGVRTRGDAKTELLLGKTPIAHTLVPFGHDTGDAPVRGELVYVGHGIAGEGSDGDYAGLGDALRGKIAVILAGAPNDPHLSPASTRPQSRVIAARDRGAIAALIVDLELEKPYPNHGAHSDLQIPVLAVGKSDAGKILAAVGGKGGKPPKIGARSRKSVEIATPIEPISLATANIGGVLRGSGAEPKRLVIGAHMDHLGHGTASSLAPGVSAIHNGADDNASGVATILALAEALAKIPASARPYDVVFFAFAAEEMGLLGSKHLVEAMPQAEREAILTMLNFDMVGRLRDNTVIVSGTGTSSRWPELLEQSRGGLTVKASDDGYGASDQTSFYEAGIPVLHYFSGPHDDYHRPSDDIERINGEGAIAIGDAALNLVSIVMRERPALDYIKVERKTSQRGGFRVSLGTIPDYAAQLDGVKLSGVRPGGPAEAAGLKAGDVIVVLAGREIHNLDDYMATFAMLKPDVEIDVVVLRGEERVSLKMTPSAPARR